MDTIRVVLADDHALFREGTRELLERHDDIAVVGEAASGEEAVALVERLRPDVAIVDIEMPGMNGVEATRQIRITAPEVAVLALTVHDEQPYVFAILDAGAAGYLLKDIHASEVVEAVRALHQGEAVLHPAITEPVLRRIRGESSDTGSCSPLLTEEECEVLRLAATGRTNQAIASELGLHVRTVQLRLTRSYEKLGVGSRTEAVLHALRHGVFTLEQVT